MNEIEKLKQKKKLLEKEISSLENDIKEIEATIDYKNDEINELEKEIEIKEKFLISKSSLDSRKSFWIDYIKNESFYLTFGQYFLNEKYIVITNKFCFQSKTKIPEIDEIKFQDAPMKLSDLDLLINDYEFEREVGYDEIKDFLDINSEMENFNLGSFEFPRIYLYVINDFFGITKETKITLRTKKTGFSFSYPLLVLENKENKALFTGSVYFNFIE